MLQLLRYFESPEEQAQQQELINGYLSEAESSMRGLNLLCRPNCHGLDNCIQCLEDLRLSLVDMDETLRKLSKFARNQRTKKTCKNLHKAINQLTSRYADPAGICCGQGSLGCLASRLRIRNVTNQKDCGIIHDFLVHLRQDFAQHTGAMESQGASENNIASFCGRLETKLAKIAHRVQQALDSSIQL